MITALMVIMMVQGVELMTVLMVMVMVITVRIMTMGSIPGPGVTCGLSL